MLQRQLVRCSRSAVSRNAVHRSLLPSLHTRGLRTREDTGMKRVIDHIDSLSHQNRVYMPDAPPAHQRDDPCFAKSHPGGLRQFVINRPDASNALNLSTIQWLTKRCWMFFRERDYHCLILRGRESEDYEMGNTFSVGVDHEVLLASKEPKKFHEAFHQLCYLLSQNHKPFIAFLNGRVGGAAAALAVNGQYRIVTSDSSFYLPQTGHGFCPDAGLCHFLSRMDGALGMYLALTGEELRGADLMHAGIGTHYQRGQGLPLFVERLEANTGYFDTVHQIVEDHDEDWEDIPFSLAPHLDAIARCFTVPEDEQTSTECSIPRILQNLEKEGTDWASDVSAILREKSPMSLEVTCRALHNAENMSLETSFKMEFLMGQTFPTHPDYAEGVQAALENRAPQWKDRIGSVMKSHVSRFFNLEQEQVQLPFRDYQDPYELRNKPDPKLSVVPKSSHAHGRPKSAPYKKPAAPIPVKASR